MSFEVIPRRVWAGTGSRYAPRELTRDPQYPASMDEMFAHYTLTEGRRRWDLASACAHMRALYNMHVRGNGWGDIGYKLVVFQGFYRKGNAPFIFAARPLWAVPAAQYRHNSGTLPIVVVANQDDHIMEVTLEAIASLTSRFRAPRICGGHRDVVATSCPGARLYRRIPHIADLATMRRRAAGRPGLRTYRPRSVYR